MTFRFTNILVVKTGRRHATVFELKFSSHRLRQERFSRPPRAMKQDTVSKDTVLSELLSIEVRLDQVSDLLLGLFQSTDIGKGEGRCLEVIVVRSQVPPPAAISCLGLIDNRAGITKHNTTNKTTATALARSGYPFSSGSVVIRPKPMKSTKPHRK